MAKGRRKYADKVAQDIRENGMIIIDTESKPFFDNPHRLPYIVFALCHSGSLHLDYDTDTYVFGTHDVSVEYPNHNVYVHGISGDYRATLVIVDQSMLDEMVKLNLDKYRFIYEQVPQFHLDDKQYDDLSIYIESMRRILAADIVDKRTILVGMVYLLSRLIDSFHTTNVGESDTNVGRLSFRFFKLLDENVESHRDVQYYADRMYLTPKYFSQSIKRETGHSASHWIQQLLVRRVKMQMSYSPDLSIQAVADRFSFPDQATFCHYFKRVAGISPSEYRSKLDFKKK